MNNKEKMQNIIKCLEQHFHFHSDFHVRDPFPLLIATILSQNTSDRNSHRAFARLMERFEIRPEVLASLSPGDIKPLISCAGLHEVKSKRIVDVSRIVLEKFGGDLHKVLDLPLDEARETFMSVKGIGPKTADVVLAFAGKRPIIPVDTNIFRVADRIGFAKGRNYERTRMALEEVVPPEKMRVMHILLIQLGREICKPRSPKCSVCPISGFCDYAKSLNGRQ